MTTPLFTEHGGFEGALRICKRETRSSRMAAALRGARGNIREDADDIARLLSASPAAAEGFPMSSPGAVTDLDRLIGRERRSRLPVRRTEPARRVA